MIFIHFLWLLFDLPGGSIWSNLVSDVVWAPAVGMTVYILHTKQMKRMDEKLIEHHAMIKDLLRGNDERQETP